MTSASEAAARPSLLAPFGGERPPAPQWFVDALAQAPDRSFIDVDGADVELLTWGEVGRPGILFLHGNAAHADWWSHIAPAFADRYRCAAISWTGMGRSDWRDAYSIPQFTREILAAIDAAGLDASDQLPIVVGHSFGTFPMLHAAVSHPDRMAGVVLVDALLPRLPPQRRGERQSGPMRHYPTLADALVRFRFMPEQGSDLPAVVDHLARNGLRAVTADTGEQGFAWCFDPQLWPKLFASQPEVDLEGNVMIPAVVIYGEKSVVVSAERLSGAVERFSDCREVIAIAEAGHHIMADKPHELIDAIDRACHLIRAPG